MSSIVGVLEKAQRNGVVCSLPTGAEGAEQTWTLLPVLAATQFDSKERYKFFANRAERCCAICSGPRKGRSAFRRGTPHVSRWEEIQRLQRIVDVKETKRNKRNRKLAKLSLERKGFHALKRCRVVSRCPKSLLSVPGRVFGGLVACDVMHGIFINFCSYFLSGVQDILTPKMKQIMDQRMDTFWGRFRNPETGQTSRAPRGAITSQDGLTAELRVLAVFLTMHVLGSQASLLDTSTHERVREHVLVAGSSLILILTAVRNKRPYTDMEWDEIFGPVCTRFFRALDMIKLWEHQKKVHEIRKHNAKHPDSPKREKDITENAVDPADSSENETDDEHRSLAGFYDRGPHIIPHCTIHFKSQVPGLVLHEYITWRVCLLYFTCGIYLLYFTWCIYLLYLPVVYYLN